MAKKEEKAELKEAVPVKGKGNVKKVIMWVIVVVLVLYVIIKLFV